MTSKPLSECKKCKERTLAGKAILSVMFVTLMILVFAALYLVYQAGKLSALVDIGDHVVKTCAAKVMT